MYIATNSVLDEMQRYLWIIDYRLLKYRISCTALTVFERDIWQNHQKVI